MFASLLQKLKLRDVVGFVNVHVKNGVRLHAGAADALRDETYLSDLVFLYCVVSDEQRWKLYGWIWIVAADVPAILFAQPVIMLFIHW